MNDSTKAPRHIGYILDGNRRWAKQHGLPTYEGHLAGLNALEDVLRETIDSGVEYVSFYTWSTENWNRAEAEVNAMMKLIRRVFRTEMKKLIAEGCRLVVVGSRDRLPSDICDMIDEAEAASANGTRATLVMCFNYGGQQEIVRATQRAIAAGADPDALTPESFAQYLDHPDVPPCDLVVRTSGEQRLSNFMLWRSAYSELMFLDKYWPEMTPEDVGAILNEYNNRKRRYGA